MIYEKTVTILYRDWKTLNEDLKRLEEEYRGIVITTAIEGENVIVTMLCGIRDENIYISVWDCKATLFAHNKHEDELGLNDEQKKLLEEWKLYVIECENQRTITFSG